MQSMEHAPTILSRSARLRCPRCGEGKFLNQGFTPYAECPECRLPFVGEDGYWTGAMYINLIMVQFLIVGGLLVLMFGTDMSLASEIMLLAVVGLLFPVAFYPFSKSIWLGMDYFFTGADWTHTPAGKEPSSRLDSRS